jgi:twitching motility two-component system response regulator PilG
MAIRKRTILVVEDSDTMWYLYNDLLGDDYDLRRASDGRRAVHDVVRLKPDLIVLDWTLDDIRPWDEEAVQQPALLSTAKGAGHTINGLDILRAIKRSPLKSIPVIMLTGHRGLHEKLIGKLLRADRYLTKPLNQPAFLQAVHSFLPPPAAAHTVAGAFMPVWEKEANA